MLLIITFVDIVLVYNVRQIAITERVGPDSATCDLYLGGAQLESRPQHRLFSIMYFVVFLRTPKPMTG
jgi:hypothetical protein